MKIVNYPRIKLSLLVASLFFGLSFGSRATDAQTTSAATPRPVEISQDDLTGTWTSEDGGTYEVRQVGNAIWWYGRSSDGGRAYTNLFRGLRATGGRITGFWTDIPPGRATSSGELTLVQRIEGREMVVRKESETGGFGSSVWKKGATLASMTTSSSDSASGRAILPNGWIQTREPDGTIRECITETRCKTILPDGTEKFDRTGMTSYDVQVASPPVSSLTSVPNMGDWLKAQNDRLLRAIERLLPANERDNSIRNLRNVEQGKSLFQQVDFRTGALSRLQR